MDNQLNIHFEVDGERAFKIAVLRALETVDLGSTEQNLISAKPEEFGDLAAKLYTAKFAETLALLIKEEVTNSLYANIDHQVAKHVGFDSTTYQF
ncbi:hypothetical protein [Schleiferilactobacillus harbinensis]|jgi:hypothetical protein|uniref:hypothetical protein n=1 Tax=Schleiferilactobacillus harbinensis TaxID=304207 RepID=UPI00242B6E8A|nr:hypothetical protein [Schleiferilactobacillus harbinensis]MCI1688598.1 hypothetical protein [Schleiferilactobacillus harbinensis]MCI1784294.1 hypothetical protein [Schleiferilactobacillus harbinensis]MCI1851796.1 hypothetical protein [Schleiferilactobacillus harbinensis]